MDRIKSNFIFALSPPPPSSQVLRKLCESRQPPPSSSSSSSISGFLQPPGFSCQRGGRWGGAGKNIASTALSSNFSLGPKRGSQPPSTGRPKCHLSSFVALQLRMRRATREPSPPQAHPSAPPPPPPPRAREGSGSEPGALALPFPPFALSQAHLPALLYTQQVALQDDHRRGAGGVDESPLENVRERRGPRGVHGARLLAGRAQAADGGAGGGCKKAGRGERCSPPLRTEAAIAGAPSSWSRRVWSSAHSAVTISPPLFKDSPLWGCDYNQLGLLPQPHPRGGFFWPACRLLLSPS